MSLPSAAHAVALAAAAARRAMVRAGQLAAEQRPSNRYRIPQIVHALRGEDTEVQGVELPQESRPATSWMTQGGQ